MSILEEIVLKTREKVEENKLEAPLKEIKKSLEKLRFYSVW